MLKLSEVADIICMNAEAERGVLCMAGGHLYASLEANNKRVTIMNNTAHNINSIPAYMANKSPKAICRACNQPIRVGELIFYHGATKGVWHKDHGDPKWKVPGTSYYMRQQMAINHKTSKTLDLKSKIKLALRRFRKELEIEPVNLREIKEAGVWSYLVTNKLVDLTSNGRAYHIVPRGFNWNVDNNCVERPDFDEDIMERDAEVEEKLNEE